MYNLPQQTLDSFQGHSLEGEEKQGCEGSHSTQATEKNGVERNHWGSQSSSVFQSSEISYDLGYYIWPKNICELACCLHRFLLAYHKVSLTWKTKTSNVLYSVLTAPIAGWRPGMLFNLCGLEFHYLYQYLLY